MTKYSLTKTDFDVFMIDGLDARMSELITHTRPKLENLGEYFEKFLTELTGEKHYHHVAQHRRRTVNPPDDTWVAFSTNNRGYKMRPHFQIGLFKDHAFCQYGIIYEAPGKERASELWSNQIDEIIDLPDEYFITKDHMKPGKLMISETDKDEVKKALDRLKNVKSGELLIGKKYLPSNEVFQSDDAFLEDLKTVFTKLYQFYIDEGEL